MPAEVNTDTFTWMSSGWQVFPEMLSAIDSAQRSIALETYIFATGQLGERFRAALIRARQRGVRVRVLVDALGSMSLSSGYWKGLAEAGGEVRFFNPLSLNRLGIRDHRKLLLCDGALAFVGGFNISDEYEGDGVKQGWRDLGVKLRGPLIPQFAESFEQMFARADFKHKRFVRLRKTAAKHRVSVADEELLLSGPGRGPSPIRQALRNDLATASSVRIMVAYFLPPWRIRRQLGEVVRRGGHVELILAGKSDVALSRLAGQCLYRRLLKSGINLFEYQPQVLHSKLLIIDNVVYLGSSNLDHRSLNINYELMVRYSRQKVADEARAIFEATKSHCHQLDFESWRRSRSFFDRLKSRWAYFLLARVDPYIAQRQWTAMPN